MYIEPSTTIFILHNCPLDTSYDHTIYFGEAGDEGAKKAQQDYFSSLTKYTLIKQTYQRVNKNVIRAQIKADNLYDCNYLMFQNVNFGNKWFYAFIKKVEYVNNITSEITYEIDVMQTWAFDYELGQSFVDREHSATDVVGDNLVPENLELGDYTCGEPRKITALEQLSYIVASTEQSSILTSFGEMRGNLYSGLALIEFENTSMGIASLIDWIERMVSARKGDAIIGIGCMPTALVCDRNEMPRFLTQHVTPWSVIKRSDGKNIANNKVYTYPYNMLCVSNNQGSTATYHWEYFDDPNDCVFNVTSDTGLNVTVMLIPLSYNGQSEAYEEKLTLSGYPAIPWTTDYYSAWLAQNASSLAVNAISTTLGAFGAIGGVTARIADMSPQALMGSLETTTHAYRMAQTSPIVPTASALSQIHQAAIQPRQAHGSAGSTALVATGQQNFFFIHKHIRPEFATIIDDYFSMYGYATHKVKIPNRNVRPHWTYTKTNGCVVHGSVPCDDMKDIISIYDRGITFWKNGAEIGNYSLDNRPTT